MARFRVRGLFRRPTQAGSPPSDSSCARRRFCLRVPPHIPLVCALLALTLPVICSFFLFGRGRSFRSMMSIFDRG